MPDKDERPPIPYGKQWIFPEDADDVRGMLEGGWLTQGPTVGEFERAIAERAGARHAVAVPNGTVALHLAALAAGVEPGDVGLTSPITFLASANCIAYAGGRPGFADVDPVTVNLSAEAVEDACKAGMRPKVVIPVDFTGVPADLPAFRALADRYEFSLIEDAAHSIGATYRDGTGEALCGSCTHTDLAIFSFHPVKHITTGEGGAVLTNDDALAERVRRLTNHGTVRDPGVMERQDGPWYYEMHDLGYNFRFTDIQARLGLAQLTHADMFLRRREAISARYTRAFADLEDRIQTPSWPDGVRPALHLYVLRLKGVWEAHRKAFFMALRERGILAQVHYIPVHLQPYYRTNYGFKPGDFPVAEAYYRSCLSIPLYPRMTDDDVERVIDAVREIAESAPSSLA